MLIAFSGLPGTGKTTVARALAACTGAMSLRIDTIEQALRNTRGGSVDIGPEGYVVGYAVAEANLALGKTVIADSVNPITLTRDAWRAAADRAGSSCLDVVVVCTDRDEHRRRVETRVPDIPGLVQPSWDDVLGRAYEAWTRPHCLIDTCMVSPEDAVARIVDQMKHPETF